MLVYDRAEINLLIQYALNGSLNGMDSGGKVVAGVEGCDRVSHGWKPHSLVHRYTSEEITKIFKGMGHEAEPAPTNAVLLLLQQVYPLEAIARAMNLADCHIAQWRLEEAYEDFAKRLLGT